MQTSVTLEALRSAIVAAGGGANALDDAEALHAKLAVIENDPRARPLLDQLMRSRDPGDFRGRALEVNVAVCFIQKSLRVDYGVKQSGCSGDIDFMFKVGDRRVYLELKHLGQDQQVKAAITKQSEIADRYRIYLDDDLGDVFRLQRDIIGKASTRKFNPSPAADAINLVAIDVSELQLATVDLSDCLLAAGGNSLVAQHSHESCLREGVVGVFEVIPDDQCSEAQSQWVARCHQVPADAPHPREYLHGVVFLVRDRADTAALSYGLRSALVSNSALMSSPVEQAVTAELYRVIPQEGFPQSALAEDRSVTL